MTLQPPVESYGTPNALGLDDAYIGVPTWDIADGLISDKPSCTPPGQGPFTSRDSMFGEVSSPMSLNQFAYAAMNPVTMWDPTGLYPTCDGKCSGNTQENLIRNFSQNYGAAVQAGTGGSGYSPGTSAQTSAQRCKRSPRPRGERLRSAHRVRQEMRVRRRGQHILMGWDDLGHRACWNGL